MWSMPGSRPASFMISTPAARASSSSACISGLTYEAVTMCFWCLIASLAMPTWRLAGTSDTTMSAAQTRASVAARASAVVEAMSTTSGRTREPKRRTRTSTSFWAALATVREFSGRRSRYSTSGPETKPAPRTRTSRLGPASWSVAPPRACADLALLSGPTLRRATLASAATPSIWASTSWRCSSVCAMTRMERKDSSRMVVPTSMLRMCRRAFADSTRSHTRLMVLVSKRCPESSSVAQAGGPCAPCGCTPAYSPAVPASSASARLRLRSCSM
mmetsp:Transcript_38922/g.111355  ORF Transcript_38922/g.111355 Transcript_38922/m.111355 type:complete len:274 (+) Transcript_38922:1575-2396(+)